MRRPLISDSPRLVLRSFVGFRCKEDPSRALSASVGLAVTKDDPTASSVRVFRNGGDRWIAETGFAHYHEARLHMIGLMRFVNESAYTDEHSRVTIDLKVEGRTNVTYKVDPMKVALGFDEAAVSRDFPGRVGGAFAQSIREFRSSQTVQPRASISSYFLVEGGDRGIDFTKSSTAGYIRMKYVGGSGYERKAAAALSLVDDFASSVLEGFHSPGVYTEEEKAEFVRIVRGHSAVRGNCRDLGSFKSAYPFVRLTSDMLERSVGGMFGRFKEMLISVMEGCDVSVTDGDKCEINYDTARGVIQLRNCNVRVRSVSAVDFVDCTVSGGRLHRCQVFESKCASALLSCCYVKGSSVGRSTLVDCYLDEGTEVKESVLDGGLSAVLCEVRTSFIRGGRISKRASVVDTEVLEKVERGTDD